MLPATYFNRLTHAMDVRTDVRCSERRRAIRIPASFRPDYFPISSGVLLRPSRVRARDISTCGIGLLVPIELPTSAAAVLALQPGGGEERFFLLCAARRITKIDSNWAVVGLTFERILRPGQFVGQDSQVSDYQWADVSGDTAPDELTLHVPPRDPMPKFGVFTA